MKKKSFDLGFFPFHNKSAYLTGLSTFLYPSKKPSCLLDVRYSSWSYPVGITYASIIFMRRAIKCKIGLIRVMPSNYSKIFGILGAFFY